MVSRTLPARRRSQIGESNLREAIQARTARIGVIGCGYVGLPLSQAFADAGFRVIGIDVDTDRVQQMNAGESHIMDVPSSQLRANVEAKRFSATSDYSTARDLDVIFISVPTPFDRAKQPDLHFVTQAAEGLAPYIRRGQLIVLESTTFPGTTDEVLRPILERGGLRADGDFYLAFSPERIDPGNSRYRIENTPKVVGGVNRESTALATLALQQIITPGSVYPVSSARAAELTKLLENTFRAVNIALVNELAVLCDRMGIDLWEVIDAAATKPYGFMPFYPGPGVGGHCIPVDPYYLSWKAREYDFHTKFIELAAETNRDMPFFAAERIRRRLTAAGKPIHGARVVVLGAAFKKDIDDARNSPAVRVMEVLRSEGALVSYHDPHVPSVRLGPSLFGTGAPLRLDSVVLDRRLLSTADIVAILVAHSAIDYALVLDAATLVFDAVNATRGRSGKAQVERL
jgi:UDP-N-acetyl-D-glucosamine dehydrogenase